MIHSCGTNAREGRTVEAYLVVKKLTSRISVSRIKRKAPYIHHSSHVSELLHVSPSSSSSTVVHPQRQLEHRLAEDCAAILPHDYLHGVLWIETIQLPSLISVRKPSFAWSCPPSFWKEKNAGISCYVSLWCHTGSRSIHLCSDSFE